MQDYNVCLVDSNGNFYGFIIITYTLYNRKYIEFLIEDIIISQCGSRKKFFEDFSANISNMVEELSRKIQESSCGSVDFKYDDTIVFNVDEVRFDKNNFEEV